MKKNSAVRKFPSLGKISLLHFIISGFFRGQNEIVQWMVEILQVFTICHTNTRLNAEKVYSFF